MHIPGKKFQTSYIWDKENSQTLKITNAGIYSSINFNTLNNESIIKRAQNVHRESWYKQKDVILWWQELTSISYSTSRSNIKSVAVSGATLYVICVLTSSVFLLAFNLMFTLVTSVWWSEATSAPWYTVTSSKEDTRLWERQMYRSGWQ